jgi:hypothetical protein
VIAQHRTVAAVGQIVEQERQRRQEAAANVPVF